MEGKDWIGFGYFSPDLGKIKQLVVCSKHQNTWEDTGNIVNVVNVASAGGYGPPSADLEPPTELSENIILNVLVEIDNTLRFSAY